MKKKHQDHVASVGACIAVALVAGIVIGVSALAYIDKFQPKTPTEAVVSKADYDALFQSYNAEIEGERVRANKFKQDFDALTLKEASEAKDYSTWSATVMAENNILRNQPPKVVKIRNNAALNECLGQLDEARDLLHAAPAKRARQLGE